MRILIASEDQSLTEKLEKLFQSKNLETEVVFSGDTCEEYAELGIYDVILLDASLPGKSGYEITRCMRNGRNRVPVILVEKKLKVEERTKGLKSGIDYIVEQPFDNREILAAVDAMLQRVTDAAEETYYGNTKLLLNSGKLVCGDSSVRLSAKEFDVMRLLLQTKDRLVSKEVLLARVWGYESNAVENHVEVYVGFLRKKLRSIGSNIVIKAVRRMGYTLEIAEDKPEAAQGAEPAEAPETATAE